MKLIAYDIANLTDARYFAARGAHMIGFSSLLSSIEEVNAMKDWVDVPAFFLRLPDSPSAELVWEWQERTGISRFLVSTISEDVLALFPQATWISFLNPDQAESHLELNHLFIRVESLSHWQKTNNEIGANQDIPVFIEFDANNAINLNEIKNISGVVIQGSDEDKVGLKSYDAVDDFLDSIEIEY